MAEIIKFKIPNQEDVDGGYATYKNEAEFVSPDRISDESIEKIKRFDQRLSIKGLKRLRLASEKKLAA